MKPRHIELKIKIKSLAAEARDIRKDEKKAKAERYTTRLNTLHHHRVVTVRVEARLAQLAYAFIRKRRCPEQPRSRVLSHSQVVRLRKMIERFGAPPQPDPMPDALKELHLRGWMGEMGKGPKFKSFVAAL